MSKSDDITKEIDDVQAETPEIVVEDAPKRVVTADEGIEGLKKQLEAEKSRREIAERQAQEAATQVYRAKAEVDDTNLQLIHNAIESVKGHTASLRNAYADAMSKGDYTKAADFQMAMSENAAKLLQLETGRQAMAERPKPPAPVANKVEALASQLTPKSAAWLRAHPECATDERLYRKMVRAHEDAIDDGIRADTPDYFAAVEARLGLNNRTDDEPEVDGTEHAAQPRETRRSSPAAAPVSRSAPSSTANPRRSVRLSPDEREMARLTQQTDEEFYRNKMRDQQRYN